MCMHIGILGWRRMPTGCQIGIDDGAALAGSLGVNRTLTTLNVLGENGSASVSVLRSRVAPYVCIVDTLVMTACTYCFRYVLPADNNMGAVGMTALAAAIRVNTSLLVLNVGG